MFLVFYKMNTFSGLLFHNEVRLIKAMVFPVIMYGCESWTIKKRLSAEELMPLNCDAGEDS